MSIAKSTLDHEVKLSFLKKDNLPTMYDLPSEEESGLPDELHLLQSEFCSATFFPNVAKNKVFVASDLNLYYDWQNSQWYKRPDWFAVVGVDRLYQGKGLAPKLCHVGRRSSSIYCDRVSFHQYQK